jgi:hypothetical protein
VGTNGDSNWDIPSLAVGATETKTWSYKPGYVAPRTAQARADALGAVLESNEGNNTASYSYSITAAVTAASAAGSVQIISAARAGGRVTVVVQVSAGPQASSAVAVEWAAAEGTLARTPEQAGSGSYRAAFVLPGTAQRVQATGMIGGAPVHSEAKAVAGS